jgi:hypothetical protein
MPHRIYLSVMGVVGLLMVFALMALRRDVGRHARTGRGLKQRLITAGLILAAAMGFGPTLVGTGSGCKKPAPGKGVPTEGKSPNDPTTSRTPAAPMDPLAKIGRTIDQAEAVASGRKGIHPFSRVEKKRLLAGLDQANTALAALQSSGRLEAFDADLLQKDLALLKRRVSIYRPTEMLTLSCYIAMPPVERGRASLAMVTSRLALLEKLVTSGKVPSKVLAKLLTRVEVELTGLESPKIQAKLHPVQRTKAQAAVAKARSMMKQIRASTPPSRPTPPRPTPQPRR